VVNQTCPDATSVPLRLTVSGGQEEEESQDGRDRGRLSWDGIRPLEVTQKTRTRALAEAKVGTWTAPSGSAYEEGPIVVFDRA
jgi:hypothetical protein